MLYVYSLCKRYYFGRYNNSFFGINIFLLFWRMEINPSFVAARRLYRHHGIIYLWSKLLGPRVNNRMKVCSHEFCICEVSPKELITLLSLQFYLG